MVPTGYIYPTILQVSKHYTEYESIHVGIVELSKIINPLITIANINLEIPNIKDCTPEQDQIIELIKNINNFKKKIGEINLLISEYNKNTKYVKYAIIYAKEIFDIIQNEKNIDTSEFNKLHDVSLQKLRPNHDKLCKSISPLPGKIQE